MFRFGKPNLENVLQKEAEKRDKEEKQREEEELMSALKGIIVFPGSKEEFEDFIKYKTEWVDLGKRDKGLVRSNETNPDPFDYYNNEFQKKIVESGVVAIVNAQRSEDSGSYNYRYGMPVKRKEV